MPWSNSATRQRALANWYLVGAYELRNGVRKVRTGGSASPDTIRAMSIPLFFDFWGVRLNGEKADGKRSSSTGASPIRTSSMH